MTEVKPGENTQPNDSVAAPDEELSEADLDAAIAEEDPEFASTVGAIAEDKDLSLADIQISEGQQAIFDEKALWQSRGKISQKVATYLPFVIYISLTLKKLKYKLFSVARSLWIHFKNFSYDIFKIAKKKTVEVVIAGFNHQKKQLTQFKDTFKYLPVKLKLAFFGVILLFIVSAFLIYRISTKGLVPTHFELFAPSMERFASEVVIYDPKTETEPFYENLRAAGQIVLMPKILVNLRPSKSSGKNPMAAMEFFLEGMSPEVAIEIKDREVEMRDKSARAIEEFSFDMAETADGKKQICEKIRRDLNLILQKGKIKRVWIKTIVLKP